MLDFGTGGLDLAYEVMRGYDALVLIDVSRQGGEPGTLYVMEPDPRRSRPIEDGEVVNPHGMDPQTVLRFVKTVGGWPGKVVVVACEPAASRRWASALAPRSAGAVDGAVALVLETIAELQTDAAYAEAAERVHELSISSAIVEHGRRARRRTPGDARSDLRVGALRQVVPDSLDFYFEIVARDTSARAPGSSSSWSRAGCAAASCGCEWDPAPSRRWTSVRARLPLPGAAGARRRGARGDELEVESIEVEDREPRSELGGERCTAPRSKVAEDALDANATIAKANRDDFDRAGVAVRQPDERPGRRQDDAARARAAEASTASASGCSRATSRGRWTPTGSRRIHVPVTQLNTDSGFGGECHLDANMVRSAIAGSAARTSSTCW